MPYRILDHTADVGIEASAEDIPTLFSRFRQLDGSATRPHGGVGLGLALARRLAGLLGGSLTVESWLGEGTEFSLRVPLKPARHAPDGDESGRLSATG